MSSTGPAPDSLPFDSTSSSNRLQFVRRLTTALQAAGVNFVFLHEDQNTLGGDIDIAVQRNHLTAVESVMRLGSLGRLVQRLHYDIPWSKTYILESPDQDWSFWQIDVVCDPFGVGRLGRAPYVALGHVEFKNGLPCASPAAQTLYLAAKRATKGIRGAADISALVDAYNGDPYGATKLLETTYGEAGSLLAQTLRRPRPRVDTIVLALREVRHSIARSRTRPDRFVLGAAHRTRRVFGRIRNPTGLVVTLAGPDGAGKSALLNELTSLPPGPFKRFDSFHFTPGVLPPPSSLIRRPRAESTGPHARTASGLIGSAARIAYLALDNALGWLPRAYGPAARTSLVIVERGWRDMTVDRRRYRLAPKTPEWLIGGFAKLLPKAHLTLVLTAPPEVIHSRKPELPVSEIERQTTLWKSLAASDARHFAVVPTETHEQARRAALGAIKDSLADRYGRLQSFSTAFGALGAPHVRGTDYSVLTAGNVPRWVLPRGIGRHGPRHFRLYRPATARHSLGEHALELHQRLGGRWAQHIRVDLSEGIARAIAERLSVTDVALAVQLPTASRREGSRCVMSVTSRNTVIAVAKVASRADAGELVREAQFLKSLERAEFRVMLIPRLLAMFETDSLSVLLQTPLETGGLTARRLGAVEESALVDLAHLEHLVDASVPGTGTKWVHGDYCGWNTAQTADGRLAVWDWEWLHRGCPLEDWFYWHVQRLLHFGRGSLEDIVATALKPSEALRVFSARVATSPEAAPDALAAVLRVGLTRLNPRGETDRSIRLQGLHLLGAI